ncbi:MAG: ACP phosphodiesterase [Bacteroidota bacterium]
MNFLAHIYLSGDSDQVKVGNFIGDFVKGNHYKNFPPLVSKGIIMHRRIDAYTDTNTIVKSSAVPFREKYGRYAGIVIDILYDHFLTRSWHHHSLLPVNEYVEHFHHALDANQHLLPEAIKMFIHRFISFNWLLSYNDLSGIERVLKGMSKRTSLPGETKFAMDVIEKNYTSLENHFNQFFPMLKNHVSMNFKIIFPSSNF